MNCFNKYKDSIELHTLKYRNPMTRTYEIDPIVSSEYSLIARTKEIQTSYSPEGYRAGYKNSPYGEYILSAQLDLFVITTKENVEFHSENLRVQYKIDDIDKSK